MRFAFVGLLLIAACTLSLNGQAAAKIESSEVSFQASDGVRLFADVYPTRRGKQAPLVLLFHQGNGDARGEYGSYIAPRLVTAGFNVISMDQRVGGDYFRGRNRTLNALNGKEFGFCDAYPDLRAALEHAKKSGFNGKRIAWGSSYTGSLVLRLAAEFPKDISGVLAFSPAGGQSMQGCVPSDYAASVKVPVMALRPASEMDRPVSKEQFVLFERLKFQTYIAPNGVHGSSMLDPGRVQGSVEEHWDKVLGFIRRTARAHH